MTTIAREQLRAIQRRTVAILSAGQVLGGIAFGATVSLGALLAADLSGDDALSGLATASVTLGASARFLNKKLLVASDVLKNEKQAAEFHAGAEYYLVPEFALRTGYGDGRFTAGTGYMFKFSGHFLAVDYAFSTDKADEGSEHIFSFDLLF